ncbi:hypothetical protein [Streptomyces sp. HD]|uniref:hypothetical protein n=1 Tax=Streptomyces sp. HD TaxID=3020892 RepID=UPI00232AC240|nr:hypothetical protein [Streptomyces sp. HD]MDC0773013.1 hypothetical protein [Streptomyces sp. HD]
MRKLVSSTIISTLLAGGVVAGAAAPASAGCAPSPGTGYRITNKSTVSEPTSLHSQWVYDNSGGTVGYNDTSTASISVSGTAGLGTEAGVLLAKASTSFSVTVGGSWTWTDSWTYTLPVKNKAGKTKVRLTLFHESKKFKGTKYSYYYDGHCNYHEKTLWSRWVTAPVKKNNSVWGLEWA